MSMSEAYAELHRLAQAEKNAARDHAIEILRQEGYTVLAPGEEPLPNAAQTFLYTGDGRRIYHHPDDPLGTFRIPRATAVVGWGEERQGALRTEAFASEGTYTLSFHREP